MQLKLNLNLTLTRRCLKTKEQPIPEIGVPDRKLSEAIQARQRANLTLGPLKWICGDMDEPQTLQDHCLRPPMRTPFIGPLYRPCLYNLIVNGLHLKRLILALALTPFLG